MSEKIVETEQAQHALDNANKQKIKPKMNKKIFVKECGKSKNKLSEEVSEPMKKRFCKPTAR